MNDEKLMQLISELCDASFECGEWNAMYSDEEWEEVYQRSQTAQTALVNYFATLIPGTGE